MTAWPDDATLDALFEAASSTKSQALRFDPEVPGGFRVLTADEDAELIDAIRLPAQRFDDDREHLVGERDTARRVGDFKGAETAEAHLEAIDDEQRRDERSDPRLGPDLPSRADLDAMVPRTRGEARAFEYLDARREIADQRQLAEQRGEVEQVADLDDEERAVTNVWRAHNDIYREVDDEEASDEPPRRRAERPSPQRPHA